MERTGGDRCRPYDWRRQNEVRPLRRRLVLGSPRQRSRAGTGSPKRDRRPHRCRQSRFRDGLPQHVPQSVPAGRWAGWRTWRERPGNARARCGRCRTRRSRLSACRTRWAARGAAPPGAAGGRGAGGGQTPDRANWYAPPFQVFDNLYWLGTRAAFLVGTSNERRHHHHRHELRLGHRARDHRRSDQARPRIRGKSST